MALFPLLSCAAALTLAASFGELEVGAFKPAAKPALHAPKAAIKRLAPGPWTLGPLDGQGPNSKLELPGWTRVIVLARKAPVGSVYAAVGTAQGVAIGLLAQAALAGPGGDSSQERDAFFADAELTLRLAQDREQGAAAFAGLRKSLEGRLEALKGKLSSAAAWEAFKSGAQASVSPLAGDRVTTMTMFGQAIFGALNPPVDSGTMESQTLLVALTPQWFYLNPPLAEKLRGLTLSSHIFGGSGEGVSGWAVNDRFERLKSELLELKTLAAQSPNTALRSSPEFLWLESLSQASLKPIKTLIFIHDLTWDYPTSQTWADFVAIDQSFGPIASQPIHSVLIHEINVNSGPVFFLPADTHRRQSDTEGLWARVAAEGAGALKTPEDLATFLGLNPYIGVVVLGHYVR